MFEKRQMIGLKKKRNDSTDYDFYISNIKDVDIKKHGQFTRMRIETVKVQNNQVLDDVALTYYIDAKLFSKANATFRKIKVHNEHLHDL
jgi:hypothetical protein